MYEIETYMRRITIRLIESEFREEKIAREDWISIHEPVSNLEWKGRNEEKKRNFLVARDLCKAGKSITISQDRNLDKESVELYSRDC